MYGIVLLAAGASARLGKPKQLLVYKGKTLLQHGLQVAAGTGIKSIIAVLGANAGLMMNEMEDNAIQVVINTAWDEGMASSIRFGLQALLKLEPAVEAVIIMVCDQPFVTTALLTGLAKKYEESGKAIIASSYENSLGTPALFDKRMFAALLALKGDTGAKRMMKENPDWVDIVHFPLGDIDIDTAADYEALLE